MTEQALRDERGRMLTPLPGVKPFTHETARIAVNKRWENFRKAANRRIVDEAKSIDPTVSSAADAFGLVASKQFQALMDSEKPRIADLEKLGNIMTGMTAQGAESQRAHEPPSGQISASVATLIELAAQIEQRIAAERDKARAVDAETIQIKE